MLDSQDPDIWFDLRHQNSGQPEKYEEFWKAVDAIINENVLKAVDSRRHGTVCHMALALQVLNGFDTSSPLKMSIRKLP